jgi:hypothetical protein
MAAELIAAHALFDDARRGLFDHRVPLRHGGSIEHPAVAALIDAGLIALFGLQHSLMARPWFKAWWGASILSAFERCTYVHMANLSLFAVIIFWQPIPTSMSWAIARSTTCRHSVE